MLGLCAACFDPEAFVCDEDAQCVGNGFMGACEANGGCSYPDPACPDTGRRWGDHAPMRPGECVRPEDTEGSSSSSATDT